MAEEEIRLEELLREARVRWGRHIARRRAIRIRTEASEAWVKYWEGKFAMTRRPEDYARVEYWRKRHARDEALLRLFRAIASYAREPTRERELEMRLTQAEYWRTVLEIVPPKRKPRIARRMKPVEERVTKLEEELRVVAPAIVPSPEMYVSSKEYYHATRTSIFERECPKYRREKADIERLYVGLEREMKLTELGKKYEERIRKGFDRAYELWEEYVGA